MRKIQVSVNFDEETLRGIDMNRGVLSRSSFIRSTMSDRCSGSVPTSNESNKQTSKNVVTINKERSEPKPEKSKSIFGISR